VEAKENEGKHTMKRGWWSLAAWAALIAMGIVAKRVYGHPDLMVFFHLPAAVFLVLSFVILSAPIRRRHRLQVQAWRRGGFPSSDTRPRPIALREQSSADTAP